MTPFKVIQGHRVWYRVCVTDSLVQRLQAVQNAAARLVSGTRRSDHFAPVLRQLHWLPVRQHIEVKMAVLVYKALNGFSPQYLVDDVNSSQPLAAGDFDRLMLLRATFHEPAQLWAIDPSLLLVHICGTIYHFIFVTLNYRFPSFAGY